MAEHALPDAPAPDGVPRGGLRQWIDDRFPFSALWAAHLTEYYAPKNLNFWYYFGSLAIVVFAIQIISGIFLVMHYKPDAVLAFGSIEYIMRDVSWGWLIRYIHSTGASAFFIVIYMHMFRGLLYGSYRKPRELVWIFGCLIFLSLMGEAFFGYLLPWGQMSFWGAQVIVNLFSAIPFIGPDLSLWIRGDYVVSDATLNRFFAFHVIAIPLLLIGLVGAHIIALHQVGSNNPDGIEIKANKDARGNPRDGIPFHPYYTVHDLFGLSVFLTIFCAVLFFAPTFGGYFLEHNNFIPANPLKTPPHIAPVWYFTPFYSMLRATTSTSVHIWMVVLASAALWGAWRLRRKPLHVALLAAVMALLLWAMATVDAKFWGVVVMGGAVISLFFLPWLDHSPVKSIRYRPKWHLWVLIVFAFAFIVLGYFGISEPSPVGYWI
ncbi:MAG: cytochrome bc complex cytochrome b subunit, partial [Betaproteobacteria bacterium]|nr:cytochrome bc complex cytochrome b subunit [Betaproteobacteria bacterium]